MTGSVLVLERDYDLPPQIVWDALVDPDLVSGWLATARVEAHPGGRYDLAWNTPGGGISLGTVELAEAPALLQVATSNIGRLRFELERLPGGTRGSFTRLTFTITAETDPRFSATTYAYWESNLDQLEDLLRGHPVDWANWQRDRGAAWENYRRTAAAH